MEVNQLKGIAAFAIWLTCILGGLLPMILKHRQQHHQTAKSTSDSVSVLSPKSRLNQSAEPIKNAYNATNYNDPSIPPLLTPQQIMVSSSDSLQSPPNSKLPTSATFSHAPNDTNTTPNPTNHFRSGTFRTRHPDAHTALRGKQKLRRTKSDNDLTYGSSPDATVSSRSHSRCHLDIDRFLSLGNMLGAGIFLGGGLMHLLPESVEGLNESQTHWPGFLSSFPLAFFLCAVGFFTILLVEEATIAITTRRQHKKDQQTALQQRVDKMESPTSSTQLDDSSSETQPAPLAAADVARNLKRNLVHGLTPRLALVPDHIHPHQHHAARQKSDHTAPVDEASSSSSHESDDESSPSSSSSESDAPGPIQSFLDAPSNSAYDSPSPFPSLVEQVVQNRHRHHKPRRILGSRRQPRLGGQGVVEMSDSGSESSYKASSHVPSHSNSMTGRSTDSGHQHQPITLSTPPVMDENGRLLTQPFLSAGEKPTPSPPLPSASPPLLLPSSTHQRKDLLVKHNHRKTLLKLSSSTASSHYDYVVKVSSTPLHGHDETTGDHGHGHGHGEDHSHVTITQDTSYIVAYLLVLALSFHSIFEGIALGTQQKMSTTISIFIAIIAHAPLAGFALGVSLVKSRAARKMAFSCLLLFTIMTPIGTVLGILLSYTLSGTTLTLVSSIFQAFSSGTFLFVALEEILPKELAIPKDKPLKLALAVLGFLLMASIKTFDTD